MNIFGLFSLFGGLAMFLYGMNVMGSGLEKLGGGKFEQILEKLTSNPIKGVVLAAAEQGLGSCWVCNFDVQRCKKILNLPDLWEPMVLLPLGYPAEGVETERKRKPFNDVVRWEDF